MWSIFSTSGQDDGEATVTGAARWTQILRHTVDVVADRGYAGASLNRIADHVGISKGLISYHFAGKDELLEALVRDVFTRGAEFVMRRWGAHVPPDVPASEALRVYLEGNLGFIAANPRDVGAVVEIVRNHRDAEGRLVFGTAWDEELHKELARIFIAGQEAGEFRRFDPRVMAIAVRRVIDGFTFQITAHPDMDADAFTAEVVTLFDHATRATPMETTTDA
ncbi:TetR/AcrR family transcriptional regulator [Glycomyces tenuis]|uniref:TetR/AcrR family transcriptional regulator n=1 Tax=Glycomyces tenuis TaxID=58116 RepID=UPI00042673B6|nr:TetR/AcrR family transcriptional regulator [Glycomyces tenuis]